MVLAIPVIAYLTCRAFISRLSASLSDFCLPPRMVRPQGRNTEKEMRIILENHKEILENYKEILGKSQRDFGEISKRFWKISC
jgi:hypothetical protein